MLISHREKKTIHLIENTISVRQSFEHIIFIIVFSKDCMKNIAKKPLVSVVMPVHNAGKFLVESINSIIYQTYPNWELIAVDDNSSDNSYKILRNFAKQDKRIKVFRNKTQLHVAETAAIALKRCKGKFIARMDADDVSSPRRFEKQIEYLLRNKKVIAVGGQCELINQNGEVIGQKSFPQSNEEVQRMIFWSIPVQQPSMMINSSLLPKNFVWYDKRFSVAEEVELIFKLFKYGKVCNLSDTLLKYRIHSNNISLKNPKKTFFMTLETRIKAIWKYGYRPSLSGVCATLAQTVVVAIIPGSWIYPIFSLLRGVKSKSVPFATHFQFERIKI